MPKPPSKQAVLSLYRSLVRYGHRLELSDKKYYFKRIREEFEARKTLTEPKELQFYFNKGKAFLERKRLI
uniref:Putative lyr motif-containing protein n=1 Tax=Rhipicephalus microplus TaxID=6941 RepID=A0A6M2CP08_RHIMP